MQKVTTYATDCSAWWMGMEYIPYIAQLQPRSHSLGFYYGYGRTALFLAALDRITENNEYCNLALSTLATFCNLSQFYAKEYRGSLIDLGMSAGKGIGLITAYLIFVRYILT
ncbi:MAG: hypothetical protein AAGM40_01810, partial [Cyanobacteria bacterium J06573_2]